MHDVPVQAPADVTRWPWLPEWFRAPSCLELPTGHHLRPLRTADADLLLTALQGSSARLRTVLGDARGWPPRTVATTGVHHELVELETRAARREGFRYGLFADDEQELLGCAEVEPSSKLGADADVWWWVVDALVGSRVEAALGPALGSWTARAWPFARPRLVGPGGTCTWQEWTLLPDRR
ncbi:N-acetyltransferase [Kineococcus glutinatus]|uniref:N-acetyltransferase n=1 Tax=Kineococcus glutinatus TaxID=1070872 RepID=UPI0031EC92CE